MPNFSVWGEDYFPTMNEVNPHVATPYQPELRLSVEAGEAGLQSRCQQCGDPVYLIKPKGMKSRWQHVRRRPPPPEQNGAEPQPLEESDV